MNFKVGDKVGFHSQLGTQQTHEIEEIVRCKHDNGEEETLCKFYGSRAYRKASDLYLKEREIVLTVSASNTGILCKDDALYALRRPLGEKICKAIVEPDLPLSKYMGKYSISTRMSVKSSTCDETGEVGWKALIVYTVDR